MRPDFDDYIRAACEKHLAEWRYDWRLYKAQLWQESKLEPTAISPAGAQGVAQFMPQTWAEWIRKTGYVGESAFNPEVAIHVGAAYMNHLLKQWYWQRPELDRIALAMASYNAGLGNILEAQKAANYAHLYVDIIAELPAVTGAHSTETITYVHRIFKKWLKIVEKG